MKILTAIICCDYKSATLKRCIEHIKAAGFEDKDILLNYECGYVAPGSLKMLDGIQAGIKTQEWFWIGAGKKQRQFDQDQYSRLAPICMARNMCIDYAQQADYDWLFFVDSDVMIPVDTKEKLFTTDVDYMLRSGMVPGRGIHSEYLYMTNPGPRYGVWQTASWFTCGFMAIHKEIFWRARFRWGKEIDDKETKSEDPLFGMDCKAIWNIQWYGRLDLRAKHEGELREGQTAQF